MRVCICRYLYACMFAFVLKLFTFVCNVFNEMCSLNFPRYARYRERRAWLAYNYKQISLTAVNTHTNNKTHIEMVDRRYKKKYYKMAVACIFESELQ